MTPQEFFKKDLFIGNTSVVLLGIHGGYSRTKLGVKPEHSNVEARIQEGATFTLVGPTLAAAANPHGTLVLSLSFSITFLRANDSGGILYIGTYERYIGRSTGCYQINITSQNGDLIAALESSVPRKDQKVSFTL